MKFLSTKSWLQSACKYVVYVFISTVLSSVNLFVSIVAGEIWVGLYGIVAFEIHFSNKEVVIDITSTDYTCV